MSAKRKTLAAVTAVSLVVLIITGTFAWTSLNSQIINEWFGSGGNPENKIGGTLHDDHEENGSNKDVYIENWGDEDLFVRIRLSEYMEMGEGAGLKSTDGTLHNPLNLAEALVTDADIDNVKTWIKHIPTSGSALEICDAAVVHSYWEWEMSGQKFYYPAPADKRTDKEYVDQGSPENLTAASRNSNDVQAKETLTAQVMTMAQWKIGGSQIGSYWVIDSDGWAYWAAPLKPGEATGLLLNKVTLKTPPDMDYYYGINVDAQMASKDGTTNNNGFKDNYERFGDAEQGGWTTDGHELIKMIVNDINNIIYAEPVSILEDGPTKIKYDPPLLNGVIYVKQGEVINASARGLSAYDVMEFQPNLSNNDNFSAVTNYDISVRITIKTTAQVGYRATLSGRIVQNVSGKNPPGPITRGPQIEVPFVIIPGDSIGIVFGKSGKVYIDYGDNSYQELRDDGSLGEIINRNEII